MKKSKRVLQIGKLGLMGKEFPSLVLFTITLDNQGLSSGSLAIIFDGKTPETSKRFGVYLCEKVTEKYGESGRYVCEGRLIDVCSSEKIDFSDKLWYVEQFQRINNNIKEEFSKHSLWHRIFHRPFLVPSVFCNIFNHNISAI